jgi:hypothetical protein
MPLPNLITANATLVSIPRRRAVLPPSTPPKALSLDMQHQEQDLWCWSAVSVSVHHFYDPNSTLTQCEQASRQMQTDCCAAPGSRACNRSWFLEKALKDIGNLQAASGGTLPIESIRAEIDAGRPVGCRIEWSDHNGHFVCIDGYDVSGAEPTITIRDPFYGTSRVPLARFMVAYQGSGSWTTTYTTKA